MRRHTTQWLLVEVVSVPGFHPSHSATLRPPMRAATRPEASTDRVVGGNKTCGTVGGKARTWAKGALAPKVSGASEVVFAWRMFRTSTSDLALAA